jgi:hypothetical protein
MTSTLFAAFEVATGRVMTVHEKSQIQATTQILLEFSSLGKAEPSHSCVNRVLFMRHGWFAPKVAGFFVIKTIRSHGLDSNA